MYCAIKKGKKEGEEEKERLVGTQQWKKIHRRTCTDKYFCARMHTKTYKYTCIESVQTLSRTRTHTRLIHRTIFIHAYIMFQLMNCLISVDVFSHCRKKISTSARAYTSYSDRETKKTKYFTNLIFTRNIKYGIVITLFLPASAAAHVTSLQMPFQPNLQGGQQ